MLDKFKNKLSSVMKVFLECIKCIYINIFIHINIYKYIHEICIYIYVYISCTYKNNIYMWVGSISPDPWDSQQFDSEDGFPISSFGPQSNHAFGDFRRLLR